MRSLLTPNWHAPGILTTMPSRLQNTNVNAVSDGGGSNAIRITDLIAGQIDMAFDTTAAVVPYVSAGRLKALAVAGPQPIDVLPGVPPIAQTFPEFDMDSWQGVFVPAGTPKEIVAKLSAELGKAVHAPDAAKLIRERGFRPIGSGHEQFTDYVAAELKKYEKVIRQNNIRGE